jgi:hypothetical protein
MSKWVMRAHFKHLRFQWYKKLFDPLGFDPCNRSLNIRKSTETPTPKVGAPLGVWRFIPSHFLSLPGFLSWPATLQPLALVVSLRLRLRHSCSLVWLVGFNFFYGANFFKSSHTSAHMACPSTWTNNWRGWS